MESRISMEQIRQILRIHSTAIKEAVSCENPLEANQLSRVIDESIWQQIPFDNLSVKERSIIQGINDFVIRIAEDINCISEHRMSSEIALRIGSSLFRFVAALVYPKRNAKMSSRKSKRIEDTSFFKQIEKARSGLVKAWAELESKNQDDNTIPRFILIPRLKSVESEVDRLLEIIRTTSSLTNDFDISKEIADLISILGYKSTKDLLTTIFKTLEEHTEPVEGTEPEPLELNYKADSLPKIIERAQREAKRK